MTVLQGYSLGALALVLCLLAVSDFVRPQTLAGDPAPQIWLLRE